MVSACAHQMRLPKSPWLLGGCIYGTGVAAHRLGQEESCCYHWQAWLARSRIACVWLPPVSGVR
jgi:hypothetical protein